MVIFNSYVKLPEGNLFLNLCWKVKSSRNRPLFCRSYVKLPKGMPFFGETFWDISTRTLVQWLSKFCHVKAPKAGNIADDTIYG